MSFYGVPGNTADANNARVSTNRTNIYFGTAAGSGETQICGMKLEKGSIVTPYIDTTKNNNYLLKAIWSE